VCGRYTLATPPTDLVEAFDVPELTFEWPPRFNVAPGQQAPIVAEDARGRRMGLMTWGLAPKWMDEPGRGFINARAESVTTKPSFREAFARRRCLIPADGFYEWQSAQSGGPKTPFWIHPPSGGVVSFAGVWERWQRPGHEPLHTFAVLTTDANDDVRPIHDRMPVVIDEADRGTWLDRGALPSDAQALLRSPPDGMFVAHAVGIRVNSPSEDDESLIAPASG